MSNITISRFKGIKQSLSFDFSRNILFYGENGSGKTSIFEALRWLFFYPRIKKDCQKDALTEGDARRILLSYKNTYINKSCSTDFNIKIDDEEYSTYKSKYKTFMFSWSMYSIGDSINILDLAKEIYMDIADIDSFIQSSSLKIINKVNQWLKDLFFETITISLDSGNIKITDSSNSISTINSLQETINEAKIKLVVILIFLSIVSYAPSSKKKQKLIIIDDVFSSIDEANKFCFIRLIFEKVLTCKYIIFTHNVNFYDAITKYCDEYKKKDDWSFFFLARNEEIINLQEHYQNLDTLIKEINKYIKNNDLNSACNKLRSTFEWLLYKLSVKLMIGEREDVYEILTRIHAGEPFFYNGAKNLHELISSIKDMCKDRLKSKTDILKQINEFEHPQLDTLRKEISALSLYRKLILHKGSHSITLSTITTKELKSSILLMKKLERVINKM